LDHNPGLIGGRGGGGGGTSRLWGRGRGRKVHVPTKNQHTLSHNKSGGRDPDGKQDFICEKFIARLSMDSGWDGDNKCFMINDGFGRIITI